MCDCNCRLKCSGELYSTVLGRKQDKLSPSPVGTKIQNKIVNSQFFFSINGGNVRRLIVVPVQSQYRHCHSIFLVHQLGIDHYFPCLVFIFVSFFSKTVEVVLSLIFAKPTCRNSCPPDTAIIFFDTVVLLFSTIGCGSLPLLAIILSTTLVKTLLQARVTLASLARKSAY